jgi:hypothetical protein
VAALLNTGESIGIAFCSLVEHVGFSVSITNSVLGAFGVMSGLMSLNMPAFLDRINRISPVPYFTRLMSVLEFTRESKYTCTDQDVAIGTCIYKTGSDVIRSFSPNNDNLTFDPDQVVFYLITGICITIAYRMIAYMVMKYKI